MLEDTSASILVSHRGFEGRLGSMRGLKVLTSYIRSCCTSLCPQTAAATPSLCGPVTRALKNEVLLCT